LTVPSSTPPSSRRAVGEARPTPNLFIVGAPKSGTTALASYLNQHPAVFVADKISYRAYLEWFRRHGDCRYRADRSVFYLYSSAAAAEIHDFDPSARIIILLRNPVDQMHSQHGEMLFQGDEDIRDFGQAVAAETDRRDGRRIPAGCRKHFALLYRDIARYCAQVERYLSIFGLGGVCVVLYDDLVADSVGTYRRVLDFLEVDPTHVPTFDVVNANKVIRSARARELLRHTPSTLRRVGRMVVPNQYARAALRRRLHGLNTERRPRPPVAPALRLALQREFEPDIHRLEQLLGRDLTAWLAPDSARRPGASAPGRGN
jgi:sulfotransferase family protein